MTLDLNLADGRVLEVGHKVRGCLLCQAAAAAIGERAPGETPAALRALAQDLGDAIAGRRKRRAGGGPSSRRSRPCMRTRAGTNACCRSRRSQALDAERISAEPAAERSARRWQPALPRGAAARRGDMFSTRGRGAA